MNREGAISRLKELSSCVGICITEEDIEALDLAIKLLTKGDKK